MAPVIWLHAAVEMNLNLREEAQRERQQILESIASNRQLELDETLNRRSQNSAYRCDLLGQIDYNRRQKSRADEEQKRLEKCQRDAEAEYWKKVEHLRGKPVVEKLHPVRRGLFQSQSATGSRQNSAAARAEALF